MDLLFCLLANLLIHVNPTFIRLIENPLLSLIESVRVPSVLKRFDFPVDFGHGLIASLRHGAD